MKTFGRSNSIVESVSSAADSVRRQRDEGLALVESQGAQVSAWLEQMIKMYKAQLAELQPNLGEVVADDVAMGSNNDSLPEDLVVWIESLKKKELQNELRGRELNTTGLKDELRARLIESMLEERKAAAVKSQEEKEEAPIEKIAQHMESMDISMEKVDEAAVKLEKSNGKKIMPHSPTRDAEDTSDPMETEVLDNEPTMPVQKKETKGCENKGVENHRPTTKASPEKEVESSQPKSPSRSPFRRMQTGMQSALKNRMQNTVQSALQNLRPVSPKKITTNDELKASPPKTKKQVVALPQVPSTDATESSHSCQSEVGFNTTTAPSAPVVPVPGSSRPFTTPAESMASSTGKLGSIVANDKSKQSSRMARLAEFRNKIKPVDGSSSTSKLPTALPTLGGLKSSSSIKTGANNKRQLLTNQMREKAFGGRIGEAAATTVPAAPSTEVASTKEKPTIPESTSKQAPTATKAGLGKMFKKESTPPPPPKQARSPILSPLDTYEMSDHGGSSDTDEEEERARRVGKRVPNWAHKEHLKQALHRQYTNNTVDPDDLFGEVTTCDLEAIFGNKKAKRYQKRTSSGNWTRDKATVAEKLAFKRQMGYSVKA